MRRAILLARKEGGRKEGGGKVGGGGRGQSKAVSIHVVQAG